MKIKQPCPITTLIECHESQFFLHVLDWSPTVPVKVRIFKNDSGAASLISNQDPSPRLSSQNQFPMQFTYGSICVKVSCCSAKAFLDKVAVGLHKS